MNRTDMGVVPKPKLLDPSVTYDYGKRYPKGLSLDPRKNEEAHGDLLSRVMQRAVVSRGSIQSRFDRWREVDKQLVSYIPQDAEEKRIRAKDPRKPVSIVVPILWATRETLMTYMASALLESPVFKYSWTGPEDAIGTMLLEKQIEAQVQRAGMGLDIYTAISDSFDYGLGVAAPSWYEDSGIVMRRPEPGMLDRLLGTEPGEPVEEEVLLWEGNQLNTIVPYDYLPDPNVPVHKVQESEFVGWVEHTNVMQLLRAETVDATLFNVKYLQHIDCRSALFGTDEGGMNRDFVEKPLSPVSSRVDVVHMYVDLVPNDWKVGGRTVPQKWLFSVAGDTVLIRAQRMALNHNMYPIVTAAPDFDGHQPLPLSRLELLLGMQEAINFFINSHIKSVRKTIQDMFVVDPELINLHDVLHPMPGKVIRLRRRGWGMGIDKAIQQLKVTDVTSGHMVDAASLNYLAQQVSGAVDMLQGIARQGSGDRSATEMAGIRSSAMSRVAKAAKIVGMMFMRPLGHLLASQTQQFMSQDTAVRITGRWEQRLREEFGDRVREDRVMMSPSTLNVNYDVITSDGTIPDETNVQAKLALLQMAQGDRELRGAHDMVRMFRHVARLAGWPSVADFAREGGGVELQAMGPEAIEEGTRKGTLAPLGGSSGGPATGG